MKQSPCCSDCFILNTPFQKSTNDVFVKNAVAQKGTTSASVHCWLHIKGTVFCKDDLSEAAYR